jgi:diamine N-acetyltransferase
MILLKKLLESDLTYRVNLLNDDAISPYINTSEKFTLGKTQKWFAKINTDKTRKDFVFSFNKERVGMGGLTNISETNKNCELYMYLDPSFQGKGFGYLSAKALCNYAFTNLEMEKVYLYTFSENKRANRLYEKVGFKLEGELRRHTLKDNVLKDRCIYGLLKFEFI